MAASKKKAVKKKVVKKAVKKAIKKAVNKKPASKKAVKKTTKVSNSKIKVTLEQRHKMICEAAYYISLEKTYETVNPTGDWLQAEAAISKICTVHSK
jgi:hypothetical protein